MTFRVRPALPGDEHTLFTLIRALARYEKLEHTVTGDAERLKAHLFGPAPLIQALLAESDRGAPLGFALFFGNYSTFLTTPGLYLEDLFVIEEARGRGVGRALLREVARIALQRGAGRLEWTVLDWNAKAITFYEGVGASMLPDWRVCRVTGDRIALLARGTSGDGGT
jgi:GNAT superfamily N-acetyltransferase